MIGSTDSESATLAWIVFAVVVFLYVLGYDLWAHYTGHLTMTGQFRRWLGEAVAGPIVAGLWIGVFVGLCFHFVVKGR